VFVLPAAKPLEVWRPASQVEISSLRTSDDSQLFMPFSYQPLSVEQKNFGSFKALFR
jgi:hypothetical protein